VHAVMNSRVCEIAIAQRVNCSYELYPINPITNQKPVHSNPMHVTTDVISGWIGLIDIVLQHSQCVNVTVFTLCCFYNCPCSYYSEYK
jgi:hypothetical protein